MPKNIIMTEDMSMLPPAVAKAVATQYGHHRFSWFEDVLNYISDYFTGIFGSQHSVLLLTCTLEGAKEAVNFSDIKTKDLSWTLGVDKLKLDDSIDAYILASEGSMMGIAGTSLVIVKKQSIDKFISNIDKLEIKPYLLDIVKAYNVWEKKRTTPYSPNISAVVALASSIKFLESKGGLEANIDRHQKIAQLIREYLELRGFAVQLSDSNAFTIAKPSDNIQAIDLQNYLAKENIFISLTDNDEIKIGHFGYISYQVLQSFFNTVDKFLEISDEFSIEDAKVYLFDEDEKYQEIILNDAQEKLLTPGPTYFEPVVFDVMDSYTYYQSDKFINDFYSLGQRLSDWMGAHNPALIMSAPSTGFMEATILNLTKQNDKGLVISHGKFGDRWAEICQAKNRATEILKVIDEDWGRAFSAQDIKDFLDTQKDQIDFICFQQNETSSGVAYHQKQIEELAKVAREYNPNIIIIMDFVSGSFAHDIDFDKADIDAAIVGSQKGLGISSGVAFLLLSDRAMSKMSNDSTDKGYFDLNKMWQAMQSKEIAYTPNIFHIYSALKSLDLIEKMGGRQAFINHHQQMANRLRRSVVKDLDLQILGDKDYLSDAVSIIVFPENIDAGQIKKELKARYHISVAGAQSDYWKPKFIRVGHLGYAKEEDIEELLNALQEILKNYK